MTMDVNFRTYVAFVENREVINGTVDGTWVTTVLNETIQLI